MFNNCSNLAISHWPPPHYVQAAFDLTGSCLLTASNKQYHIAFCAADVVVY